jgi:hypothetical protein
MRGENQMQREVMIWIFALFGFGVLGSTARYLHELGKKDEEFSFKRWAAASIVGGVMAILTGFLCKHWEVSDYLTYSLVGFAAMSARELINLIPTLLADAIKKRKI